MYSRLLVPGVRTGSIHRVDVSDGHAERLITDAGRYPDGLVVAGDRLYWTTMGAPTRIPGRTGESALNYAARNGGLRTAALDGSGVRDLLPPGSVTTPKQLAADSRGRLYWGDREGGRVSRAAADGSGLVDLYATANPKDPAEQCVGVAVDEDAGFLYWTQKGPGDGGVGRILRAALEPPEGPPGARGDVETLWSGLPEPIDLEIADGHLYWTDRGAPPEGNTLNRAALPAAGEAGAEPEILADGFTEAIGLAVDVEAGVVYVSDLGGRIRVVPIPGGSGEARVLADLGEPLTGIAGLTG